MFIENQNRNAVVLRGWAHYWRSSEVFPKTPPCYVNTEYSLEQASIWVFFQSPLQVMSNIQKCMARKGACPVLGRMTCLSYSPSYGICLNQVISDSKVCWKCKNNFSEILKLLVLFLIFRTESVHLFSYNIFKQADKIKWKL